MSNRKTCYDNPTDVLHAIGDNIKDEQKLIQGRICIIKSILNLIDKERVDAKQLFFLINSLGGYLQKNVFINMYCQKQEYFESVEATPKSFIIAVRVVAKGALAKYNKRLNMIKIKNGELESRKNL